jgi:NTE family protein
MPSRETIALLLQGGGALGSYQAGAYEALAAANFRPDWLVGISIGAINAAIIAGNEPGLAVERLRQFWLRVSSSVTPFPFFEEMIEATFNQTAAATTMLFGAPGFFKPRPLPPFGPGRAAPADLSYYDSSELKSTLEDLVDFDRINSRAPDCNRLSVGAVGVMNGNFRYFDSAKMRIGPEHIMASGALPPGLPPIRIDGEDYWDGGLVSNTPLQFVIDEDGPDDILAFQVDLFSARGPMPCNLWEVAEREKDIRYSSRSRLNTDMLKRRQAVATAAARLKRRLPDSLQNDPDLAFLVDQSNIPAMTLVHIIYKTKHSGLTFSKDYDFSRAAVESHWQSGLADISSILRSRDWRERIRPKAGELHVYDPLLYPKGVGKPLQDPIG